MKRHSLQCVLLKAGVITKERTWPDFLLGRLLIWLEVVARTGRVASIEKQLAPFCLIELESLLLVLWLRDCFGDDVVLKVVGLKPRWRLVEGVGRVEVGVIHGYYIRFLLRKEGGKRA